MSLDELKSESEKKMKSLNSIYNDLWGVVGIKSNKFDID